MKLISHFSGPIARATLLSLAIQVGGIALGVAQALLTARLLGPEGYGSVAYVISLAMLFSTIVLLGTEPLAVREVARLRALGETGRLIGFLFTIRWLVTGTALLAAAVAALTLSQVRFLDPDFGAVIGYTALLFPLFALIRQNQGALRGFGKTVMAQAPFQVLRQLVVVGFLASAWVVGHEVGPKGYLNAALVGAVVALVAVMFALKRQSPPTDVSAQAPSMVWLGSQALPFFVGSVLALLLGEINTLMLAWWTDAEQTGLFQPIARIAPLIMLGTQAAAVRYAPRVSEFWATGAMDRLTAITRIFTLTTTAFSLFLAIFVLFFGDIILGLFGEAFANNTKALWWVVGAQVFSSACGPVGILLNMTNRAALAIWPQAAALFVSVAAGYFLIPTQGVLGAAIAMSLGIVTWNSGMLYAVRKHMDIEPSLFGRLFGKRVKT
jgi:O-antigen/teichoic acid export membrane protein